MLKSDQSSTQRSKIYQDLEEMLFGFGNADWPPNTETVLLVENLVKQYIEDLCLRSMNIAEIRGKLDRECFMYLVRKDRRKFNRIQTLLQANEEIKKAKTDIPSTVDANI